ncbi:hypothetical protein C8R48DRAFT_670987 [Suillus tomentosus]|nr:hypothetical protein C8R48DRAFT_670987 [Suillus tomentosus]
MSSPIVLSLLDHVIACLSIVYCRNTIMVGHYTNEHWESESTSKIFWIDTVDNGKTCNSTGYDLVIGTSGTLLTAKLMSKKGYHCPFVTCPFIGLPAVLYMYILTHINIKPLHGDMPAHGISPQKRPLEDPFSLYPDTLFGGSPSNTTLVDKLTPLAFSSCSKTSLGDGETTPKKHGCRRFEHPVWACNNDLLQDFWVGIPYLVFTISTITQIVFNFLDMHYTDEIMDSIHSFATWLYTPSTNGTIISSGYP